MGNNRVFDYTEVARIYGEMNTITGDSGDPTSIAGLLHKINEEFTDVVNGPVGEDELALKGDAASDLKNSWDNTVGDHFAKFVENFGAWSTVVAQSAGDYSQFEQAVKGIKSANPLGWNSGGATDTASATGFYSNALSEQELTDLAAQAQFYQLTGATYVDTGMVSYAEKKKIWNTVQTVLAVGSIVSSGFSIWGAASGGLLTLAPSIGTPLASQVGTLGAMSLISKSGMGFAASNLGRAVAGVTAPAWLPFLQGAAINVAAWAPVVGTGFGLAAPVVGALNPNYDPATYLKGNLDMPVAVGESKTINGAEYTFMGSSNNGKNIYYDANKNIVYDDGHGNLLPVTDSTGQNAVYVEGGNTVLNAGNEVVGPQTTLKSDYIPKLNDEDYGNYFEKIDGLNENSISLSKREEAAAEQAAAGNVNVAVPGGTTPGEDDESTSGTNNGATTGTHQGNSSSGDENTTSGNNNSNNYTQGVMI